MPRYIMAAVRYGESCPMPPLTKVRTIQVNPRTRLALAILMRTQEATTRQFLPLFGGRAYHVPRAIDIIIYNSHNYVIVIPMTLLTPLQLIVLV